jgi:hypothetical protein
MVEQTPLLWGGRLVRFESVRTNYPFNALNFTNSYFRYKDVESGEIVSRDIFGVGYAFGNALVVDSTAYAFGTDYAPNATTQGTHVQVFSTTDMGTFTSSVALKFPSGYQAFNTAVWPARGGYYMAIELGKPSSIVGTGFTIVFAHTKSTTPDSGWELLDPMTHRYSPAFYSACPTLRYLAKTDEFYMTYLYNEGVGTVNGTYAQHLVRSSDLSTWAESPYNPILVHSPVETAIAPNTNLTLLEQQIADACSTLDINASDMDFVALVDAVTGKPYVHIDYIWGNQHNSCEFLASARFDGTLETFLLQFFP